MGIDKGGDIVVRGNVVYELMNEEGGVGVEGGIGLMGEEILRVEGNGGWDGKWFLDRGSDLRGEFMFGLNKV